MTIDTAPRRPPVSAGGLRGNFTGGNAALWHPIKHYKTIHHHKVLVRRYCFRCGLYWQGLVHDLSKLAPVEFLAGAKYWQGTCSPNNAQRQAEGYSAAWLHHKGRN